MADYSEDASSAFDDIAAAGVVATVRRTAAGVYDPVTDSDSGATVETYQVPVVLLPLISSKVERDKMMVDNAAVLGERAKALIPPKLSSGAPLPFFPAAGMELIFGAVGAPNSEWWDILGNTTLQPDLTPILHTLTISRGRTR